MSIISTKQLRENMPQVIYDLRQGESIQLSYRHSVIGVLQPIQLAEKLQGVVRRRPVKAFPESFNWLPTVDADFSKFQRFRTAHLL